MWRGDDDIGILGDVFVFFSSSFVQGNEEGWGFFMKEEGDVLGTASHWDSILRVLIMDAGCWISRSERRAMMCLSLFGAPLSLFLFGTALRPPSS
jgi:hypothetical protein